MMNEDKVTWNEIKFSVQYLDVSHQLLRLCKNIVTRYTRNNTFEHSKLLGHQRKLTSKVIKASAVNENDRHVRAY